MAAETGGSTAMSVTKLLQRILLSLVVTVLCLVIVEAGLRLSQSSPSAPRRAAAGSVDPPPPLHIVSDTPELYVLNPEHPDVSSQGFRNAPVAVPKPDGLFRILILGDSVAYGGEVPREMAFPFQLQQLLRKRMANVEVVNAGVAGYSPYNELHAYLVRGRTLAPDLVIVAMCLNDVVNPRLHWGYTKEKLSAIPEEAIPNQVYDREVILPRMQQLREDRLARANRKKSFADTFVLYRLLRDRIGWPNLHLAPPPAPTAPTGGTAAPTGPANVPTYLSGEDSLSIQVLLDGDSPERQWLESTYEQIRSAVESDGAAFAVVLVPLAYQMDEGYPYLPQDDLIKTCADAHMQCLDLLPFLKRLPKRDIFLLDRPRVYYDVWHFTATGHAVTALAIEQFLVDKDLVPHTR